ncbi:DMT family transporter [Paracoccus aerodenitrificans]|uniref:DMT family transporter n=1 Tax=Paracoccus aerodenitrificans TaxID=3017781 RepID=UPI0022F0FF26|nr:DMT family transporter [Paracoccus aerodenitrificans]WBU64265.1 DMT family transporter [Paracoccus aerodenitrificans]
MAAPGNLKAIGFALMSMGVFATHDVIIKLLGAYYPSLQVLFFSSLLSFPLVSLILLQEKMPGTLRPHRPGWVALRSFCAMMAGVGGFYAFSVLPLAQVYAILFSAPLLITLLSIPILGERVGIHRWLAVTLGLCGVLIVLRPGAGQALSLGHLAALMGAFCSATAAVITRKIGGTERPLVLLMWPMLGNLVLTGTSLGFDYVPMQLPHLAMAGMIAVLGLTGGFLSILAYRIGEAAIVAPMQYSQIIWATIYGWFIFGEALDLRTMIGAGVIIVSGIYIVWRERTRGSDSTRPVIASRLRTETVTAPRSSLLQRILSPRGNSHY